MSPMTTQLVSETKVITTTKQCLNVIPFLKYLAVTLATLDAEACGWWLRVEKKKYKIFYICIDIVHCGIHTSLHLIWMSPNVYGTASVFPKENSPMIEIDVSVSVISSKYL